MADARLTEKQPLTYALAPPLRGRVAGWLQSIFPSSLGSNKKRDLIQIQWFVAITCCYLLLFEEDQINYSPTNLALLTLPLGSVLVFSRLPESAFAHRLFPQAMALVDTALFSTAIIFNRQSPWDLVLVFFFGIFISAIGENLLQIVFGCLALSVVSLVIVPLSGKGTFEFDSGTLLRIPLLFGASLVYGYLSQQVKEEKRKSAQLAELSRQQLRMKDQFLSHVSHELRTPIAAVQQFATILSDGIAGELNEDQREYVGIILRNVKQLRGIVGDLLDATRADSGKLAIDPQMILLQSFVPQTLTMLMPGAAVKGITLSAEISDDLPFVYADPQRVNQILTNLIDNAMKFTAAKGQIIVRAEILDRDPAWVHVSVADTGCGIGPEAKDKIFDRLYQEERTVSSRKGLGIGLHICKELVARHGGNIWVDSKIGVGSTFHFTLPVYSLTAFLIPLMEARDRLNPSIELIAVQLRFDQLSPTSEPVKAAWRAVWNSLNELSGGPANTVVMPRMTTSEEQGLIFLITSDYLTIDRIRSAANKGVADCAAVRHSACRIEVSSAAKFTNHSSSSLEQRAGEMAKRILNTIARIQAEKSAAATCRLDFMSEISRQVRTPATVVAGYAGMLRDKLLGELTSEQERVVEKVLAEINDLMLTVTNIFEAERLDSMSQPMATQEVNVGALLQELKSIHHFPPNETIRMVWDCPEDLPIIVSDGNKLRLVLQNVIHRSLKLSMSGDVTVTTRYSRKSGILEFTVAAAGNVFLPEMFRSGDQVSLSGGNSNDGRDWGNYLIETCTRLLGGTVAVESDGEKSIVIIRLPVKETPAQRQEAVSAGSLIKV